MHILILGMLVGIFSTNCKKEESKKNLMSTNVRVPKSGLFRFVSDIGINVISPAYDRLAKDTKNLETSILNECVNNRLSINRDNLKHSFLKAMRSYHFMEAFQIGAIARNDFQLREQIYSWPQSNSYLIDVEIMEKQKNPSYQYRGIPTSVGFSALEYMIYEEKLVNQCSTCGVKPLENWNDLPNETKIQNRCEYMIYVAKALAQNTKKLSDAWKPVNGDITLSPTYRQDFKLLKEFAVKLTHSLIFFDKEIKDRRLGIPGGINFDLCGYDSCPEQSEHFYSKDSISSLLYASKGLLAIFTGDKVNEHFDITDSGRGYEEWLTEKGHQGLAQDLKRTIVHFIKNLQSLQNKSSIDLLAADIKYRDCKRTTSENRIVEICALYQDLKKITDLYKTDFLLAMDFGRPKDQGGDTD